VFDSVWTGTDAIIFFVGGLLLGVILTGKNGKRSERPIARMLALILEPLLYWLDAYGADGRPSHRKVTHLITLGLMLFGVWSFGGAEIEHSQGQLSLYFVLFASLVMAFALGPAAYNAFLNKLAGAKFVDMMIARRSGAMQAPSLPSEQRPSPPGMEAPDNDAL